jgi:hypothetical protein
MSECRARRRLSPGAMSPVHEGSLVENQKNMPSFQCVDARYTTAPFGVERTFFKELCLSTMCGAFKRIDHL